MNFLGGFRPELSQLYGAPGQQLQRRENLMDAPPLHGESAEPASLTSGLTTKPRLGRCLNCDVRHLSVCSAVGPGELEALAAAARHREVDAGETIFTEGDPVSHLYNLSDGTVRLFKLLPNGRRQIMGFLFAGDFLGLASDTHYSCSAEAVTPATFCQFERADFQRLLERFPGLRERLLEKTNHELSLAQAQMLLLGRKTPSEKVASFLLGMASQQAVPATCVDPARNGDAPIRIVLPMGREDIADYLGLTIETVSRTLTRLKVRDAIAIEQRTRILIKDPQVLAEIAEED